MNNYDKILNYTKENNGYITAKELESLKINNFNQIFIISKIKINLILNQN